MPLPEGAPALTEAESDVLGASGWYATGDPVFSPLVQPAAATITAAATPHTRIDGLGFGSAGRSTQS